MAKVRITSFLTGRLLRNVLFWLVLYLLDIAALSSEYHHAEDFANGKRGLIITGYRELFFSLPAAYYIISLGKLALMAVVAYTNNLLLVPRLLKKKKYVAYAGAAMLLLVVMSFAASGCLWVAQHVLPNAADIVFSKFIAGQQPFWPLQFFIGYIQLLLLFTIAWYLNDYATQKRRLALAEKKRVQAELSFLKGQLNPHFLFNNLNNLYALAIKKSDTTPTAILWLSAILRHLLYESNSAAVPFEKEKEVILAYTQLERLRMADDKNLHLTIEADKDYHIPPLLWLPLLENMFKHGVHALHGQGYGEFTFTISNNRLRLYSRNKLSTAQQQTETGGIGLSNLQKRLDLLYEGRYSFARYAQGDAYIVDLSIDLA